MAEIKGAVRSYYDVSDEAMVMIQGNHDDASTTGLAESGNNDKADYGVFGINEDDYMRKQGVGYSEDVTYHEGIVKNTAVNLKTYLDDKLAKSYDKPIFIVSHLPLHYSRRISGAGDGQFGGDIFDVINQAGQDGLNIFFIFGHNHTSDYDDHIGSSSIYLKPGDEISVAKGRYECQSYTLSFVYMNAGYITSCLATSGVETAPSMVVYEIYSDRVEISRYNQNGICEIKAKGIQNDKDSFEINETVYTSPMVTKLTQFRQKVWLSDKKIVDSQCVLILQQHLLNVCEMDSGLVKYADMNDDGAVDSVDLNILMLVIISAQ